MPEVSKMILKASGNFGYSSSQLRHLNFFLEKKVHLFDGKQKATLNLEKQFIGYET